MPSNNEVPSSSSKEMFVISRTFNAPRELVWKVFTEAGHLQHWWGPKGVTIRVVQLDLRPGGMFHYCMTWPNGSEMWAKFAYREIVAPERIVYMNSFSDANGGVTRHPMNPDWPAEMFSTVLLTEHEGKTTFTVQWSPHNASAKELKTFLEGFQSMEMGWGGTLDKFGEYLANL